MKKKRHSRVERCAVRLPAAKTLILGAAIGMSLSAGCGLLGLRSELKVMDSRFILSGMIANAPEIDAPIWVFVLEQDPDGRVVSADATSPGKHGAFGFFTKESEHLYVAAYADSDGSGRYEPGEPAWVHTGAGAAPAPVVFLREQRKARVVGRLSTATVVPDGMLREARRFAAGRPDKEVLQGWQIPVQVGEIADLDDPRFSSKRGAQGLWEPASFPMKTGVGIFFLEPYDPSRVPVLFVYGAGGSPQDFRDLFDRLDRNRFQAWFYLYPTGRRLDEMAAWLEGGVSYLQEFYGFDRMAVVAHSMGGLVARAFINQNLAEDRNRYLDLLVTMSTPWSGHQAAASGVERSPVVIPAWYDLAPGSEFLEALFSNPSPDFPEHHLFFSFNGETSMILPPSNDRVVSMRSQLRVEAQEAAVRMYGIDDDHVGILRQPAVAERLDRILRDRFAGSAE